jgi:flagellin
MGMFLTNTGATINALRNFSINAEKLNKSLERLSSGYKINRAADGAASLLISENLRSQMRGYSVAITNSQQGLSMLQTADGALQQITDHLQKIREIAVAASNETTSTQQFAAYQADLQAELAAIDNIATNTKYGSHTLLDGSIGASFNLQIGPNSGDTLDIAAAFTDNQVSTLGIDQNTLSAVADATTLLGQVDTALGKIAGNLAKIGQYENSVENQMNYLSIANENTSAAEASIRNTDVATEIANVARYQILQQAGAYALSQIMASASLAARLLQ